MLQRILYLLAGICITSLAVITDLQGQTAIDAISSNIVDVDNSANDYTATSSSSSGQTIDPSVSYDIFFSRSTTATNNRVITGFTLGVTNYNNLFTPDTLIIRRVGTSTRLALWMEAEQAVDNVDDEIFIAPERQVPESSLFQSGLINIGYSNAFINTGGFSSNIERIDAIYTSGLVTSSPSTTIVPILDLGHDAVFKIAMITSLDANGDPATYGDLIEVEAADFGTGVQSYTLYIDFLQQVLNENPIPTGSGSDDLGGVALTFTDLGIAADEVVFGYSLFSIDVNTVDDDLTDISTFPTNTDNSGLDLAAGAVAIASSDALLAESTGPGGYKSSLATWLLANVDADVTTSTEASSVTDWQDHWFGDNDATTGVAAPTYRSTSSAINFNPTIDFTSGSTSLTIANNTDFNTATSYERKGLTMVFRTSTSDVTTRQVIFEQGGATRGINAYIRSGNLHVSAWNRNNDGAGSPWNNGGTVTTVSFTVATDTEYILTIELDGDNSATGDLTAYLNGQSFGTISSVGLLFSDTDGIELGASDGTSQYDDGSDAGTNSFEGEISEFIYCNEPASFTSSARNQMESYLAIKYGITLDQSTPINYTASDGDVIFNATDNAASGGYLEYNSDIAGIGRDDESELDQPASRSENSGLVTIDRGATISTDDTWLIWGHDDGALTETDALTMPDTIDMRISRVWRVSEINEVLTTSVSFDLTGLGLSTNEDDFALLVAGSSSSADFSSASVVSGGSITSNVLTFTGVDLEHGEYFTLGTNYMESAPGGVEDGLQFWVKADVNVYNTGTTLATDGQTVSGWADNSNEATSTDLADPSNLTTFLTNQVNYNPAVDFDNVARSLEGTFESETAGLNMYLVGNISSGGVSDATLFEVSNGTSQPRQFFNRGRYASNTSFSSNVTPDRWNFWGIDHPSGTSVDITENSGVFETSYTTTVGTSPTGTYNVTMGDDATGSNVLKGLIGELIVYEGTLTSTEVQKIESYIGIKYGITLDQTSATNYLAADGGTIWDATTNAAHNNDIAGIGRDDLSGLNQKQSKSENSDGIVTIGLGTIEEDNSANSSTFGSDDSFLIWGNNDGATDFASRTTGVTGAGTITERMTRIWRVDENTDIGNTSVSFDLTGLGYSSTVADYQLMVSSNSDLSSSTQFPAATLVDNVVTFSEVNMSDGQYFSLGTARDVCGPGGVSGDLYVWLRADAGTSTTTDNSTLSTWSDQSSAGTDAASDGNPPLYKNNSTDNLNYNPTIDFDGTDDRLSLGNLADIKSGAANGGDYTLVAVGLRESSATNQYVIGSQGGTANEDLHFGYQTNTVARVDHWSNGLTATTAGFSAPQAPFLLFAEYDGSGRILEQTRGSAFRRNTDSNTTDIGGTKTNYIGDVQSLANYNGLISEVIIFSNDITDLEKQQIYSYLALKYGITLTNDSDNDATTGEVISGSVTEGDYVASDGSTIIWDFSANSSFHFDVAGIGRDEGSCWQQKQSRAEDTDDILRIGLGAIATTNSNNVNTFDDDLDFLIWGNNNGSVSQAGANTGDLPATVSERMSRIWKVEDTGNVGETELQFDLTGLGFSSSAADFSLIVSNSATMASGTLTKGGTFNGSVLSFTGVDLTDGQFFTLATANDIAGPGGVNSNVAIWFRADTDVFSDAGVTTANNGDNVLQWNDQSAGGNNASEDNNGGGTPIEPTYQTSEINFNPVIRFSNAQSDNNSWLETASNNSSGALTLISVFKTEQNAGSATDFTESPALISAEAANSNDYALLGEGRLYVNAANNDSYNARSTATYVDDVVRIGTATRAQSTAAGSIQLYVNSENVASGVSTNTTLNSASTFAIGNHSVYDADGQFEGDIAETIVFDVVLSETERARVESYLALKYGITRVVTGLSEAAEDYFAADGGIIWNIDAQGITYHNDIFGIGRDDLSDFVQLKSKSENSDAIVIFEKSGSFSSDDVFIVSGNDNADLESRENTEMPAGIESRLNREWKVQRTGSPGSILVTFELASVSGPSGIGTNDLSLLRLMVDNDGDFTAGVTLIAPTSVDEVEKTATFTVNFTSGQFYTLGSTESYALPVTLVSFTANNDDNERVIINWTSAQEIGNSYYTIERSKDGVSFESIGARDGAGDSNALLSYQFIDTNPLNGQSFYRLKQTDFDGSFEFSEMKRVFLERPEESASYKVYPNPVNNGEQLFIERPNTAQISNPFAYQIISLEGDVVSRGTSDGSQSKVEVDTSSLAKGVYLLRIITNEGVNQITRFIID
jgi:hypothetical protein